MEDTRKIKEIYDCAAIVSDEELYPLQKWYNQLIDKTIYEITVPDVLRMIRQKQWIDLAMSKAINLLKDDVFAGESFDGELLEKVSELDGSFLVSLRMICEILLRMHWKNVHYMSGRMTEKRMK